MNHKQAALHALKLAREARMTPTPSTVSAMAEAILELEANGLEPTLDAVLVLMGAPLGAPEPLTKAEPVAEPVTKAEPEPVTKPEPVEVDTGSVVTRVAFDGAALKDIEAKIAKLEALQAELGIDLSASVKALKAEHDKHVRAYRATEAGRLLNPVLEALITKFRAEVLDAIAPILKAQGLEPEVILSPSAKVSIYLAKGVGAEAALKDTPTPALTGEGEGKAKAEPKPEPKLYADALQRQRALEVAERRLSKATGSARAILEDALARAKANPSWHEDSSITAVIRAAHGSSGINVNERVLEAAKAKQS